MRITHPLLAVPIAMVAMLAQVLIGVAPVTLLMDPGNPLYRVLGMIGIALASIGLVYLLRRLGKQPRLPLKWSWSVLTGLLVGLVPVVAANALSVVFGVASWASVDYRQVAWLALSVLLSALGQAFPEELLWRGHLFDTLSGRLSPRTVLIVVSVGFGALHILSQSPADTLAERLLYVVAAIALGFACAAARVRSGTFWMAVGVHTGFHLANIVAPTRDIQYGAQLLILTVTVTTAGALLLSARASAARPSSPEPTTPR